MMSQGGNWEKSLTVAFLTRRPSPLTLKTGEQKIGDLQVHIDTWSLKTILTLTISREEHKKGAKMAGPKHLRFIRDLLILSLVLA